MVSLLYLYLVPLRCLFQLLSSCRFLLCRASLNDSTDALHTEARSHPLRLCTDLTLCMLAFASTRMPYVNNQVGVKTKCLRCEQQESRTGCNCDLLQHQKHQTRFSEILFLQLIVIAIVAAAVVVDLIAFFFITHNHFICSWMRWISFIASLFRFYYVWARVCACVCKAKGRLIQAMKENCLNLNSTVPFFCWMNFLSHWWWDLRSRYIFLIS